MDKIELYHAIKYLLAHGWLFKGDTLASVWKVDTRREDLAEDDINLFHDCKRWEKEYDHDRKLRRGAHSIDANPYSYETRELAAIIEK